MMNAETGFTEEQLDFIREMMNIGSGNAGTALAQFLDTPVELLLPEVHAVPVPKVVRLIGDSGSMVSCARMRLLGDLKGNLLVVIPESQRKSFTELTRGTMKKHSVLSYDMEKSMLLEIANIVAGVFLTAIHDACGWNIYHMVPELSIDMLQAVLDEPLQEGYVNQLAVIVIERLLIGHMQIDQHLIIIANKDSLEKLLSRQRSNTGAG
jgi:chemotaxis protein CheC